LCADRTCPRWRPHEDQAWNEPNICLSLVAQLVGGKPVTPGVYRELLNSFARAVNSVHRDNVVIPAGLAPFRDITPSVQAQDPDWVRSRSCACSCASRSPAGRRA
jgi:hypothetical protein